MATVFYRQEAGGGHGEGDLSQEGLKGSCSGTGE